ncbi:PDZ and LIM domain protein 3-like isoform X1 [Biomphalaria glabrata]|uniref:PDZ and LIM domain protein 3-like isoform X1 n=1 Tax=Biomphalaria glabrata TaxID=6526 RepID=A0A9W2ZK76_BIOGL|nr:PDZ and LIM domain protein 3-like isoform X1 [Biomphalaria glabrata]
MSNVEYKPAEKLQIRLVRPDRNSPWGFRLQGGIDFNTPLSIQSVNPGSVSEQCGLKPGDAILAINNSTSDAMTHDEAKAEIMRSGDQIYMLVERGAVKIWKPQVTPLNELRPTELKTIQSATGEEITPVQRTSLAINKPPDEPCKIGSTHNRSAQPFGQAKAAVPNVVHAQYNSPMGLYSANNIADTYSKQTEGIQAQMQNVDLNDPAAEVKNGEGEGAPSSKSVAQSAVHEEQEGETPEYKGYTNPNLQSRSFYKLQEKLSAEEDGEENNNRPSGFRSVSAPIAKPASEKPQQPSMRCGGCDMLATGVIVKANGVPYHVACFKCTSCSMNLKQKGFFVVDGKLYCETHAKRQAQPPGPDMVAVPVYR